jgi:hypothetical protein
MMRLSRVKKAISALLAVAVLSSAWAGFAAGERNQQGNLIVALKGKVSPTALPRDGLAPAKVTVSSRLSTTDSSPPPRTKRIELAFAGRNVRFGSGSLPTCPLRRIRNTTDAQALARCGSALVGHGRLAAVLLLPRQAPLRVHARLLAFNGRAGDGRDAVWAHAFSTRPPASFVLPFVAHRNSDSFPNALTASMPRSAGEWAHLTAFRMTLGRRYRDVGGRSSYLAASCPAPADFTAGFFYFARVAYTFADGRSIKSSIVRACRVRK